MGEGQHGQRMGGLGATHLFLSPPCPADVPSAPLLLTVEDVSDCSVTVSWEPPEKLGSQGLQGYVLEFRKEGGELWAKPCMHSGKLGLGAAEKAPGPCSVQGDAVEGMTAGACPKALRKLQGAPGRRSVEKRGRDTSQQTT